MKTTVETDLNNNVIRLQKRNFIFELTFKESLDLQNDLKDAIYLLSKHQPKKYKEISLEMLKSSIKNYSLTWDDVIGFDFCATRMQNSYPSTTSEGKLLLKREMTYQSKIG